jgi:hypothetical protein
MFKKFTYSLKNYIPIYFVLLIFSVNGLQGQVLVNGDFRSKGTTGKWAESTSWDIWNGTAWVASTGSTPSSGDNVYLDSIAVIELNDNAACKDLHFNRGSGRLKIEGFTLSVNGKMRIFNGFAPGISTTSSGSTLFSTTGVGVLKLVGNSRLIFATGEWAANGPTGANIEFALNPGEKGTANTPFKARKIIFSSGNFETSSSIRPDGGVIAGMPPTGDLLIKAGGTLTMTSGSRIQRVSATDNTAVCNSVVVDQGGKLVFTSSTPGGSTSTGGIDATTISFNGDVIYTSSGSLIKKSPGANGALPNVYYNLIIDSGNKTLDTPIIVNGILDLNGLSNMDGGKISLDDNNLTIGSSGSIEGDGPSKYIVTNGTGSLIRNGVGSSSVLFPVGTVASPNTYRPATISHSGTANTFSVNVVAGNLSCSNPSFAAPIYWNISKQNTGGSSTLTLDYGSSSTGLDVGGLDGPDTVAVVDCNSSGIVSKIGTISGTAVTASGFTTFSPFGLSSDPSLIALALPVKLTSFTGQQVDKVIELEWSTSSETNSDYFEVLSSPNGSNFRPIGKVKSAGNSSEKINYSLVDEFPHKGINYYQLRQVDLDGKYEFSEVITVENTTPSNTSIYPSLRSKMELNYIDLTEYRSDEKITINLYDASGRQITNTSMKGGVVSPIDFGQLNTGLYMVKISNQGKSETLKFSVY